MTQPTEDNASGKTQHSTSLKQRFHAAPYIQPTDYILRYLAACRLRDAQQLMKEGRVEFPNELLKSMMRDLTIVGRVYARDFL